MHEADETRTNGSMNAHPGNITKTYLLLTSELQAEVRPIERRRPRAVVAIIDDARPSSHYLIVDVVGATGAHDVFPLQRRPAATLGVRHRHLALPDAVVAAVAGRRGCDAVPEIAPPLVDDMIVALLVASRLRVGVALGDAEDVVGVISRRIGRRAAIFAPRAREAGDARTGVDYHRLPL